MRLLLLAFVLAAVACAKEPPAAPELATGSFTGVGDDALCVAGEAGAQRAGFVTYGADEANCSASGTIEPNGDAWTLTPKGDSACSINLRLDPDQVTLGPVAANCAYYCGPGATYAGKAFRRSPAAANATDLAGDPLC